MLVRLFYASKVVSDVTNNDIKGVLASAQANNSRRGITGALCFTGGMFLQCLEGHRREVNQLYHTIIRDKRHRDPAILLFEEISRRDFSEWSMGYLGYTPENRALFLRYSAETTFDPYSMSADSLKQFFKDVGPSAKWFE